MEQYVVMRATPRVHPVKFCQAIPRDAPGKVLVGVLLYEDHLKKDCLKILPGISEGCA